MDVKDKRKDGYDPIAVLCSMFWVDTELNPLLQPSEYETIHEQCNEWSIFCFSLPIKCSITIHTSKPTCLIANLSFQPTCRLSGISNWISHDHKTSLPTQKLQNFTITTNYHPTKQHTDNVKKKIILIFQYRFVWNIIFSSSSSSSSSDWTFMLKT